MTCNFTMGRVPRDESISPRELYTVRRKVGECIKKVSSVDVNRVEDAVGTLTEVYNDIDLLLLWIDIQINYTKIKGAS